MDYQAEIFDLMQQLYEETGFNDHMVHCVARFAGRLDATILEKAVLASVKAIPILGTRFVSEGGKRLWRGLEAGELARAFVVAQTEEAFETETLYRVDEAKGPQVRLCLLEGENSAVAVTMNHMIADGAGFKDYLYLVAETYSRLLTEPAYSPPKIDGDRGIRCITGAFGFRRKVAAFIGQKKDSNREGSMRFPFDGGDERVPFIATREIGTEATARVKAYCKERGATLNDAVLAAYYRVLARRLGPGSDEALEVPVMIDMRRYLKGDKFTSLRNLASTTATRLKILKGETYEETLCRVRDLMNGLKRRDLGLGGYAKMSLLFSLMGQRLSFELMRKGLKTPLLCMTNLGELDARRFVFGPIPTESAFACGSIKHKPHFQVAVSGFKGRLTLSSNLYGTEKDRANIDSFLREVEEEMRV